jgi:peptidoglycan/xylan/chitin deacetylase (PgdA/CDA1 family)
MTLFFRIPVVLIMLLAGNMVRAQPDKVDNQAVILQYHHVSSTTPRSTSVTADEFRQHMEYLRDNEFTVLPLQDVVAALRSGTTLPDKSAVITFDDGYISVYETAFPLLQQYGWPFTIFVPSGLIGSNAGLYASWDQLREMGNAGATLANHSVSHSYLLERLEGEDEDAWLSRIEQEIVQSEQQILQQTGQSHKLHAYPYGEYDLRIQQLVTRLGYIGIGQHSGPINATSDFTALPRFPFSGIYAPVRTYAAKVSSLAFKLKVIEPQEFITTETSPAVVIAFEGDYSFHALTCYDNDQPMQLTLLDEASRQYRLETEVKHTTRRFHYNCTAPGRDGRYYWYSVPWINPAIPDA